MKYPKNKQVLQTGKSNNGSLRKLGTRKQERKLNKKLNQELKNNLNKV